jgi:hypothetical protein
MKDGIDRRGRMRLPIAFSKQAMEDSGAGAWHGTVGLQ